MLYYKKEGRRTPFEFCAPAFLTMAFKSVSRENIYLSVVIPAYNEAQRLPATLLAIDEYLERQEYQYEIIVVIDGATDQTAAIVNNFQNLVRKLKFFANSENHGKGYVVRQGMLAAKGELRLFMDADGSTSIDHVEKMLPFLTAKRADVVITSRDSKDARGAKTAVKQSFLKRLVGNMGNLLIQLLAVPGIWDTQNGFKVFTARAAEDIFSRTRINRWGFDIEVLALASRLGYKIAVVPAFWKNDPRSHVTFKGYLNTFRELFIIRINLWRNIYHIPKLLKKVRPLRNTALPEYKRASLDSIYKSFTAQKQRLQKRSHGSKK